MPEWGGMDEITSDRKPTPVMPLGYSTIGDGVPPWLLRALGSFLIVYAAAELCSNGLNFFVLSTQQGGIPWKSLGFAYFVPAEFGLAILAIIAGLKARKCDLSGQRWLRAWAWGKVLFQICVTGFTLSTQPISLNPFPGKPLENIVFWLNSLLANWLWNVTLPFVILVILRRRTESGRYG
jgi:hypothetical protein